MCTHTPCTGKQVCTHGCTRVHRHRCVHAPRHAHAQVNMYTYRHIVRTYHRYTRARTQTQVHACVHRYTRMYTHSHAQMHVFPQVRNSQYLRPILWASTRRPLPACRGAAPQPRPQGLQELPTGTMPAACPVVQGQAHSTHLHPHLT